MYFLVKNRCIQFKIRSERQKISIYLFQSRKVTNKKSQFLIKFIKQQAVINFYIKSHNKYQKYTSTITQDIQQQSTLCYFLFFFKIQRFCQYIIQQMQDKISFGKNLLTVSEFSTNNRGQSGTPISKVVNTLSQIKEKGTYYLQNSLNSLYVRRLYLAFRNIKNYNQNQFKIHNESSFASAFSQKSSTQSMENLLFRLKNNPQLYFYQKRPVSIIPDKKRQDRKKIINSIFQKLSNVRQCYIGLTKDQQNQNHHKRNKSSLNDYNSCKILDCHKKSEINMNINSPSSQEINQTQQQHLRQQNYFLTKFLMKEVIQLKKQLDKAKQTTAKLLKKQLEQNEILKQDNNSINFLSQYNNQFDTRQFHQQQGFYSARNQRKISQSHQNASKGKQQSKHQKCRSQEKKPQVVINHHIHNYYVKQTEGFISKHKLTNSIKPYKKKIISELIQTTNKTKNNCVFQQKTQNTVFNQCEDRVKVIITQNPINNKKYSVHVRTKSNFSTAIRSRCTGIPEQELPKNA